MEYVMKVLTSDGGEYNFAATFDPPTSGLNRFSGSWTKNEARHLLSRGTFGGTLEDIKHFEAIGLDAAVEELLKETAAPSPPLTVIETNGDVFGTTWINNGLPLVGNGARWFSLRAWLMLQMMNEKRSITTKMSLFWHNHFVTAMSIVGDARYSYRYFATLWQNATGNFRQLAKDITVDLSMLRFLNGNSNTERNPNENFARELFELFTIGKGPLADAGDYTYYTEDDIISAAKVLTGWRDDRTGVRVSFNNNRHSKGDKQFSHRWNNKVIKENGENEYKDLIDMIFENKQTARYIAKKLYRWFINSEIDENIETLVINPLADIIYDNDYEIKPALSALLKSEHFYDTYNRGAMIKNPVDHVVSTFKQLYIPIMNDNFQDAYTQSYNFAWTMCLLQDMIIADPPEVAGWAAYYQIPSFSQLWINSVTISYRHIFTDVLCSPRGFVRQQRTYAVLDVFSFADRMSNPSDAEALVKDSAEYLFPIELTKNQIDYLKTYLSGEGLPDYLWTLAWLSYKENPNDEANKAIVYFKLATLYSTMLSMPEYHLM